MPHYGYDDGSHALPAVCGPVHIQNKQHIK